MRLGTRVGWILDGPDDPAADMLGSVAEPTSDELVYAADRYGPETAVRCVLVEWDEDDARAWHDPAELREVQE